MGPATPESMSHEEVIVVFKVDAFCTLESTGRKRYIKSQTIQWHCPCVDFSIESALFELTMHIPWGCNQCATICFVDNSIGKEVRLQDEGQVPHLMELFRKEGKISLSVTIHDIGTDLPGPSSVPPTELGTDLPGQSSVPSALEDLFDNPEEYVGVHDEACYGQTDQQEGAGVKKAPEEEVDDDTTGLNIEEEGVPDDDPDEIHVSHDPENPCIEIGSRFPDLVAFRKAIRHHAILTDFEFKIVKTDKTRFIAICKSDGCPWRIHASRAQDGVSVTIKTLHIHYTCSCLMR